MIKIIPNKKDIGAQIECDLKKISNQDLKKIKQALIKYGVIFFRKQILTSSSYIKFAKNFGKLAKYPRLKGLNKKYPQITVVQRKAIDKGPSFGEQFHTDSIYTKKPPRFTMLLSKLVPKKGLANTEFCSQYLAYKQLPAKIKKKLKLSKGIYSSEGPISITTQERVKEKGRKIKELISTHKILKKINSNYAIYCSPGHLIDFKPKIKNQIKLKKLLLNHQVKKKFQYSLEWEKNQLAIWDNRSMLHQATPFKGNRIMHRITIH
jgi:taurine dioxygenase